MSKIEWTEKTWNPIVGCSVVSPGCTNCYAMTMAARLERMGLERYRGLTKPSKAGPVWTGKTRLVDEAMTEPLRRRKPTMWFVNSMSDLFHESVPDAWIDRVFAVMALCPQHTFQVLTKRSARMRTYLAACRERLWNATLQTGDRHCTKPFVVPFYCRDGLATADKPEHWPLPNVWLGVSTEDQRRADERVPDLLATPAAVRFVSAEPLLGPIDLTSLRCSDDPLADERRDALRGHVYDEDPHDGSAHGITPGYGRLNWIIVGGESGRGARPMHPAWARSIRDQCEAAGVPYFFKQWGAWAALQAAEGKWPSDPDGWPMQRVGKKAAGRLLDGVEHNGLPQVRT